MILEDNMFIQSYAKKNKLKNLINKKENFQEVLIHLILSN